MILFHEVICVTNIFLGYVDMHKYFYFMRHKYFYFANTFTS